MPRLPTPAVTPATATERFRRRGIHDVVEIHACDTDDRLEMWMVVGSTVKATAAVALT